MRSERAGCFCCGCLTSAGIEHCPSCHSVAMHGLSEFNFVSVVNGIPVYWGTDQAAAVHAAQAGAGYVTVSPILADFRQLADDASFRPVLSTPYGDTPIPLDAVRQRRLEDGSRGVLAGVADRDGSVGLVDLGAPVARENRFTRAAESPENAQHADTVALPRYGATGP